jgi:malonate-semialdehyde dehydrogenase (acetylating)/methylmalonate-semialdehyde dehydrogenase
MMTENAVSMEKDKLKKLKTVGHFIAGSFLEEEARTDVIRNPATGNAIGKLSLASKETVEQAITAAQEAFPAWRNTSPIKRARVMFAFKNLLEKHSEEAIALITQEQGKILNDARGEFQRGVEVVEYACGAPELLKGEHNKNVGPGIDCWSEMHPLGVVAGITPFNFPAMVPMWMFPMAIVCGNTFILKPSEKDPSVLMFLAKLLKEAGLPDGVFNIVNGDKEAVDTLLEDERVQALSFVGSTAIASYVYEKGTRHGKRVQALGGAKNHAVIMPDANLDNVVNGLLGAAYGSCGERCMAISVAVCVGDDLADALVEKIKEGVEALKVGPGTDESNEMGPLITKEHFEKVKSYLDIGVEEGADLIVDGRGLRVKDHENGYFLGGCLFDNVKPHMRIYKEEIFGPVLAIVRVKTHNEALKLIDNHEYGNGTCIFTNDGETARYFTDNVKVGMVGVNVPLPVPVAYQSFGGWKRSLFGDLYAYGPDSVRFYTRRKTISQRWPSNGVREGTQFAFPS